MITEPDVESLRRKKLINVQKELQRIWDLVDFKMWFGKQGKRNELEIQRLWEKFENLEVIEKDLLRTGSMMTRCVMCNCDVWNGEFFVENVPFCRGCN